MQSTTPRIGLAQRFYSLFPPVILFVVEWFFLRRRAVESSATTYSSRVAARWRGAEVLFLSGDMPDYREVMAKLRSLRPGLRMIVTNRIPDNRLWLDALEAGAADYCGAPFEKVQVRWLLDAALRHPVNTAA